MAKGCQSTTERNQSQYASNVCCPWLKDASLQPNEISLCSLRQQRLLPVAKGRQSAITGGSCHKHHFCHNRRCVFFTTNMRLLRQNTSFVATKICLPGHNFCRDKPNFVATKYFCNKICLSRQAYFCRYKRYVLSRQTRVCRNKTMSRQKWSLWQLPPMTIHNQTKSVSVHYASKVCRPWLNWNQPITTLPTLMSVYYISKVCCPQLNDISPTNNDIKLCPLR